MSTALIIDGNNLLQRSVFAARRSAMSTADGVVTGPLVLFVNGLAKHIRIEQPERLLVVWDGGTSKFRQQTLPSYKANRRPVPEDEADFRHSTFELVYRFCALAGIFSFRFTGTEADDLVAGAWANLRPDQADKIVIISSDKDFLQLLGPNPHGVPTEQIRLSSAGTPTDRWDEARVHTDLGYAPAHWPLVTALSGDTGDGVPGLPGIGPKKAVKLLEAHDWQLGAALATRTPQERDLVLACHLCVDLRHITLDLAVPRWRPTRQDSLAWRELVEFLSAHELRDIKDRLMAGTMWSDRDLITATQSDFSGNDRVS